MAGAEPVGRDLAAYYARRAAEYDRIYDRPERQEELARLRARLREDFSGRRVLELACGTGYWTAVIAETALAVEAQDINEEVLTIARARGLDPSRVRFGLGDAYAPPSGRAADAGLAAFWWSHLPRARWESFLAVFRAALAPGAIAVFVDNNYVAGSSTPVARRDAAGDTWQVRRLADGSAHEVLKNFPSPDELRAAFAGHAAEVEIESLRYYWRLRCRFW